MANVTFALYRGWRDDGHAQNSAMVVPTVTVTSGLARVTPTPTALSSLMRGGGLWVAPTRSTATLGAWLTPIALTTSLTSDQVSVTRYSRDVDRSTRSRALSPLMNTSPPFQFR